MSAIALPKLMTTEELLALPDDGVERWLIRGELREKGMTVRNRFHSGIMAELSHVLVAWLRQQPEPRGKVLCGEAGVRLRSSPDSTVGVDIAYISAELACSQNKETTLIDGAPLLAVEILSPNDTIEEINSKTNEYLKAGVALIWIVDPYRQTVEIIRPESEPELVNVREELTGDPHLPGFRVPVAQIFS